MIIGVTYEVIWAAQHCQQWPRRGVVSVERGRRWLARTRLPIGAFHLSTPAATKLTNHIRHSGIIVQFFVAASASSSLSSRAHVVLSASENAVSVRIRRSLCACRSQSRCLSGREVYRWWVNIAGFPSFRSANPGPVGRRERIAQRDCGFSVCHEDDRKSAYRDFSTRRTTPLSVAHISSFLSIEKN